MMKKENIGVFFLLFLACVLCVCKIAGIIDCSWLVALSPLWVPVSLLLVILFVITIAAVILIALFKDKSRF